MDTVQLENGYVKISNELLEAMALGFPGFTEGSIIMCILRKTYGWNKKSDTISISQLVKMTGRSRRMVIYALQNLEAKKMIFISRSFQKVNEITFNKKYKEWELENTSSQYQKLHLVQKVAPSAKNGKNLVQHSVNNIPKVAPTINTITKDTIQKKGDSQKEVTVIEKTTLPLQGSFSLKEEITQTWIDEIALKYSIPTSFIEKTFKGLELHSASKPDYMVGRTWKGTLESWVFRNLDAYKKNHEVKKKKDTEEEYFIKNILTII